MRSDDAAGAGNQDATPVRAPYEPPMIEVVETVDGVAATVPGIAS